MRAALALILFATTPIALPASAQQQQTPANPKVNVSAAAQQDFKVRLDQYLAVRKKAAGETPAPKQTNDPAQIVAAEEVLVAAIRAVRPGAKPGDIFTPEIQATFRKLLAPELKGGDGAHTKDVLKDDAPAGVVLKVNGKYPDGKSFPSVPSNLILNLPKLPPEVEYRIIGNNLILRDTGADIIVDFMLNAIK
jgi:hypothetical protein